MGRHAEHATAKQIQKMLCVTADSAVAGTRLRSRCFKSISAGRGSFHQLRSCKYKGFRAKRTKANVRFFLALSNTLRQTNVDLYLDRPALEAIFHLPNNDGSFDEEPHRFLAAQGARRPVVLLAFAPKSAGTFLRAAAVKATGGEVLRVCYAQGDRDAQLYLPTFLAYYAGGFCAGPMVTHVHMQAFPANTAFLSAFGIRPIVMVRNIPDMLASYWDMVEDGDVGLPMGLNCTIPADFSALPTERRADFMIDVIAPWYAGYYATWSRFADTHPDGICLVRYSRVRERPGRDPGAHPAIIGPGQDGTRLPARDRGGVGPAPRAPLQRRRGRPRPRLFFAKARSNASARCCPITPAPRRCGRSFSVSDYSPASRTGGSSAAGSRPWSRLRMGPKLRR